MLTKCEDVFVPCLGRVHFVVGGELSWYKRGEREYDGPTPR